jgi:hypothetical protein
MPRQIARMRMSRIAIRAPSPPPLGLSPSLSVSAMSSVASSLTLFVVPPVVVSSSSSSFVVVSPREGEGG